MSQKATRKSQNAVNAEEKERADTPVKEMKKKIAANAEKDKQAAEKTDKPVDKADKSEPADKNKPVEKPDKNENKTDKNVEKSEKPTEKKSDKSEKPTEKKSEKPTDKKPDKPEKVTDKKSDKSGDKKADKSMEKKSEQAEKDESKGDKTKEKVVVPVNGHNGTSAANGSDEHGTVSDGSDGDLVIEEDEVYPELAYDDSDTDVEDAPSRSLTRRSQVKVTKTPETPAPRPASDRESEDSKESKVLKMNETVAPSDRKLRSADSPKPDAKKDRKQDAAHEEDRKTTKKDLEAAKKEHEKEPKDGKDEPIEVDVVVEVESTEGALPRTRARVSPYSRTRLDRTATSVTADYTGNNSTMEMDITESSFVEEPPLNDSGYLRGLRAVRGRSSYKLLNEIKLSNPNAGRPRPQPTAASIRPTGAVVGRKRKPSAECAPSRSIELGEEATDDIFAAHGKRMKLLERLSMPFRRSITRRAAEIVGINTDLPLTAPLAATSAPFDPETIKPAPAPAPAPGEPVATPLAPLAAPHDRDGKRCAIM